MARTLFPHAMKPLCLPRAGAAGLGGPVETRASSPPQGLVAIPVSVFYSRPQQKHFDHYIRFCFVKVKGRAAGGKAPHAPHGPLGVWGEEEDRSVLAQDESTLQAMDKKLREWKDELGA